MLRWGMTSNHPYPQDMQDALEKFGREAEQIVASFVKTLESQKPPPIIYHYTDDAGLRGILETGQLWLTNIFNLNDPSELSHGLSHAVGILNRKAANGPPESKLFAEDLAAFIQQGGIQNSGHYFMCSFSSCRNDLGQWRAYADDGRGYALGFDSKALEDAFDKQGSAPILRAFPITYKDVELIEIHRKIVEAMFGLISLPHGRNLTSAGIKAWVAQLSTLLMVHALDAAVYFKHEAYSNEKEYRFLEVHPVDQPPKVKYRGRPYSLIKYREFDWKSALGGALKQIVVGPAADHTKAQQFADDCLHLCQSESVEITHSDIPYRVV